jgi:bacterioferritin
MKGNADVLSTLRVLLKSEQTAMAQYRVDAQMLRNAGYISLKHKLHGYFYEENDHSKKLLNRLLLLGGTPDASNLVAEAPQVSDDVQAILNNNLALEYKAIEDYNAAIKQSTAAGDDVTSKILRHILCEENGHAAWLEKQLAYIKKLGIENYLVEQMD